MYEVKHAGSKGFGVFATRHIARGTRILAERPTFTVTSDAQLLPAFKKISTGERAYINGLSTNTTGRTPFLDFAEATWHVLRGALNPSVGLFSIVEYKTLLAAFRNNSFAIDSDSRAIFHDTSRINHSCVPNAQGNLNTSIGAFTIHAVQAIEQEQEINISYLDELGSVRAARQARLTKGYGFECNCPVCDTSTARGQESERRRRTMREKLTEFAKGAALKTEKDLPGEVKLLMELVRMFELEGLAGRELGTMYLSAAEGSSQIGDASSAVEYARRGLEIEDACLGSDSPLYKESVIRAKSISADAVKA